MKRQLGDYIQEELNYYRHLMDKRRSIKFIPPAFTYQIQMNEKSESTSEELSFFYEAIGHLMSEQIDDIRTKVKNIETIFKNNLEKVRSAPLKQL